MSDAEKIAFFSASGFEGNRGFLYSVNGSEIKVHHRQRKKGIPPILTMKILPTDCGCRLLRNIAVEKSSWADSVGKANYFLHHRSDPDLFFLMKRFSKPSAPARTVIY